MKKIEPFLVKEEPVGLKQDEKKCQLFIVVENEGGSKKAVLKYISEKYDTTLDLQILCHWREKQPRILRIEKVINRFGQPESQLCFWIGLNDFSDYKDEIIIEKKDIISFLKKFDLSLLNHLDAYYNIYPPMHIDVKESKVDFSSDHDIGKDYRARLGIFDDLLEKKVDEFTDRELEFPLEIGNKFISFMGNLHLLHRLFETEVLLQRIVFDENKWYFFDQDETINEAMKQHVANREMINRQFQLLEKYFWEEKK